jgi:uncharacterized membrane protein YfcA
MYGILFQNSFNLPYIKKIRIFTHDFFMEWYEVILIVVIGFIAGFLNTLAGGGSLITLPILIFLGLPPAVANGTNRIAIFSQNIFGVLGFRSKGVSDFPYSIWLGMSAFIGAILGAKIAVDIPGELFNKILAVLIVVIVLFPILKRKKDPELVSERTGIKYRIIGIITFFFVGIYGGFVQAGVGFIIIAALTIINRFSLVKTNGIKVFVVLIYTISALFIFILEGKIHWGYGLTLAVGNSSGSWIASRLSVKKGDAWVRWFIIITVIALAIKLWLF